MSFYANTQTWVGCAREATRGTAESEPLFWVPATLMSPRVRSMIKPLEDVGDRGEMTDVWDVLGGPSWEEYSFKCLAHVDILPHLLRSVLGSPDTVTPGPSSSYYHAFSLLNNDGQADQPPSYTWYDWDGLHLRTIRGGQTDSVQVNWQRSGLVEVVVRVLGYQTAVSSMAITPVMPGVQPVETWDCTTSLGGVSSGAPTKGSLTLTRKVQAISTFGQQFPYSVFAGPLGVRGSVSFLNQTDAELDSYLAYLGTPIGLSFASAGGVAEGVVLSMTSIKSEMGAEERGPDGLITATLDFVALPNTTDATAGGHSPLRATVQNYTPTSY